MKVLRAAVLLGVSTPLIVLGCGSDDGTVPATGAGGEGGEGPGSSGSSLGGEPSHGGVPSVEGGAPNGGSPDAAGQPSVAGSSAGGVAGAASEDGGAGGVQSATEPVCGDAELDGGLLCFEAPTPLTLVEGTPTDVAIGSWDDQDGLDVVVAGSGLVYFSNEGGTFPQETYRGNAGTVLGSGQLSTEGDLDLLLGETGPTTIAFGNGDGTILKEVVPETSSEGQFYNFFVADVAGTGPSADFVVTHGYSVNVVVTSGNGVEEFQTNYDGFFARVDDGVLAKLGSAQWVVYSTPADSSSPGAIGRRVVTVTEDAVSLSDEELATPVGGSPAQLDAGDFNEDGFDDVVATLTDSGNVSVLFADGAGSGDFTIVEGTSRFLTLTIGASEGAKTQRDVKVGDFNGDGHEDIAVSVKGLDGVAIFAGDGDGAFSEPTLVSTGAGSGPTRLAVGDLNDDGVDDLAVVGETSLKVILLLSDP